MKIKVLRNLLLILLTISSIANAEAIKLGDKENYNIGLKVDLLEDENKSLEIEDIIKSDKFQKSTSESPNYGFSSSAVWVRFKVLIQKDNTKKWLLEIGYPLLDKVNFYIMEGDSHIVKTAGDTLPFSEREIDHQNFVFNLKNTPGLYTYYLRVETTSSFNIPLKIWSTTSFISQINTETIIIGIIIGAILIMLMYNILMAIRIKEITHVYYVLLGTGYLLMTLVLNGIGFQYIWPNTMWLNDGAPFTIFFISAAIYLFVRSFFKLKNYFEKLDKMLLVLSILCIIGALISFHVPYLIIVKIATLTAISTALLALIITIFCIIKKIPDAVFILIAFISIFLGAGIVSINRFGLIPSNILTLWGFNFSFLIKLALLSMGIADQINTLKDELFILNRDLEEKVEDRTSELNAAIDEMTAMNDVLIEKTQELGTARDALWGEMELARKIQTVLLPKNPAIPGFDVSAYMMPADEVGGDYYDIINTGDINWLVIGDVSGHGIVSGLIMMMTQTLINFSVRQTPGKIPSEVLTEINRQITQNIKKLGGDKYMTITVMAAHQNNKVYFSGLHQDIYIYRSSSENIETVETSGMWLGLFDDISENMTDEKLDLQSGDVMLLYTDGVTEGWEKGSIKDERNPEIDMFGNERLKDVLKKHGKDSAATIKDHILKSIEDYVVNDDITLLVVKKLSDNE